jgi:hypothetical protein
MSSRDLIAHSNDLASVRTVSSGSGCQAMRQRPRRPARIAARRRGVALPASFGVIERTVYVTFIAIIGGTGIRRADRRGALRRRARYAVAAAAASPIALPIRVESRPGRGFNAGGGAPRKELNVNRGRSCAVRC